MAIWVAGRTTKTLAVDAAICSGLVDDDGATIEYQSCALDRALEVAMTIQSMGWDCTSPACLGTEK